MKNAQELPHENPLGSDCNPPHLEVASTSKSTARIGRYAANILISGALLVGLSHTTHQTEHFPALPMPVPDQVCTPASNYVGNGINDSTAIVNQADKIPRANVLLLAKQVLNARTLGMDVDFGQWENTNLKQRSNYRSNVINTVRTAYELGDRVEVTLEQTPKYEPNLSRALSYWNASPTAMASFSYSVASKLGNRVLSYSPENAPNDTKEFSESGSMKEYDAVYLAGYNAIKKADPNAQVWTGQLDPEGNLKAWIVNLIRLPSQGLALHSYQLLNNTHTYVEDANPASNKKAKDANAHNVPVYITEYGDPASDPRQLLNLKMASVTARCDGASGIVYYQFIQTPKSAWNTGIYTVKKALAASGGVAYKSVNSKSTTILDRKFDARQFELAN